MSLRTLRIAIWLALVVALGCGFFMAYSLMFIAAAFFFFLVFLVLVIVVGSEDGSNARYEAFVLCDRTYVIDVVWSERATEQLGFRVAGW
jgi:hypothetical protein